MREPSAYALLLGLGGDAVRKDILKNNPLLDGRVFATGLLKAHDLSSHLAACDLVFQPFPDGVTTRRTSVMASLAHGLPVLTNQGHLTEEIWSKSGAVALSPVGTDIALSENISHLLASDAERARLGSVAQSFYREHFDIARTIASLRAL
jgi:glycosyltransferase involved in cell wall biosynthesis